MSVPAEISGSVTCPRCTDVVESGDVGQTRHCGCGQVSVGVLTRPDDGDGGVCLGSVDA